jgi:hypothetical protein
MNQPTTFVPFRFSPVNDANLLRAAGYEHEFYEDSWEDVGGPESGPKLVGNPDMDVFSRLSDDGTSYHCIVVVDGWVVEVEDSPAGPAGWADQF